MKKTYVTPAITAEVFEANEYVSACTIAEDGISEGPYNCGTPIHPAEEVTFAPNSAWFYNVYNKNGDLISVTGRIDPGTNVMHWGTIHIEGRPGCEMTTNDHYVVLQANHS